MNNSTHIEWIATLHYHLRRGPVIVSKASLKIATDQPDTRNACRALTRSMLPKEVHFIPMTDGVRVTLI